ncbi:DNA-directed RNA polymerase III complex subunit Rpc25 [Dimargaris xerosporica]|nr:DNA-directed RNA polymerase III complex subunit Rpc25 [Dimargaris xerosporica]
MFVLATLCDSIKVEPAQFRQSPVDAVHEEINRKYANRIIQYVGLCVTVFDVLSLSEGLVYHSSGTANYDTRFRLVVFRPFVGEVLLGKVRSCSELGVHVSLGFFEDVLIPPLLLPDHSEFDAQEQAWVWKYEGNELFIDNGESIRFRVVEELFTQVAPEPPKRNPADVTPVVLPLPKDKSEPKVPPSPYIITGSIQEDGLGPLTWWSG